MSGGRDRGARENQTTIRTPTCVWKHKLRRHHLALGRIGETPACASDLDVSDNWLCEVGNTRILTDGYITRIPQEAFSGVGFAKMSPAVSNAKRGQIVAHSD